MSFSTATGDYAQNMVVSDIAIFQQLSEVGAGNRLVPCRPLVERDRPGTLIIYAATLDLRMFWLIRKKFVGSYLFFSFTSRS